jgi:[protein-PII] uridylyltransferase
VLGVVDAEAFCQRHSLSQFDTEIVKFLVRHHLLMSSTSQKLDVQDPDVVKHFAANVQTIDRLNYLYLITVADIRATNNELWNGWRDSLLKQLYHNTKQWLVESEKLAQNTHEKAIKIRQQALEALTTDSWSETEITELWQNFELSHFAQYTIETIVWQTQSILSHPRHETIIAERALTDHTLEIFIYTTDKSGLFAAMTSCFERLDLDILDAKIGTTSDGKSLNSYVVNGNLNHKAEIIKSLTDYIDNIGKTKFTSYSGVTPRTMKLFETKPSVSFYNNESQQYTVLELGTHDRPGLLSSVARVFLESNIQLANAKLTTLGDQVEDVFFIKTDTNVPLSTQEQDELREVLIKQLTY